MESFKILSNGNKVTCAVILQAPPVRPGDIQIIGCHPTGKTWNDCYDLPKGCANVGEDDIDAALRELREETGGRLNKEDLVDLGIHPYLRGKDIHVFYYRYSSWDVVPLTATMRCKSYFTLNGKQFPEMDYFNLISEKNWNRFSKGIQRILNIKEIHDHLIDY